MPHIHSLNSSPAKGTPKQPLDRATVRQAHGIEGDAHAGSWHRQISLLDLESIEAFAAGGRPVAVGDFAENITTQGIDLGQLQVGDILSMGADVVIAITQIGKECHGRCGVYHRVGDCIMPKRGLFAEVLQGGELQLGDPIQLVPACTVAILTLSDQAAAGQREDAGGPLLARLAGLIHGQVREQRILPDDLERIEAQLREWSEPELGIDLILTTGGTGFSQRDVTPEATSRVIERPVPGLAELIRAEGCRHNPRAALSRAVSGIRNQTLIVNLPGSPRAVSEGFAAIRQVLPHGLAILNGAARDCGLPPGKNRH